AEPRVCIERADVVGEVAHRNDRVDRTIEEAHRKADDVARQDHIEDLPLAATKQLVANGVAVLDEAEITILVADDDQVLALFDQPLALDNALEASEIGRAQFHETRQPRRERMFGEQNIVPDLSCNIHGDALGSHLTFFY